MYSAGVVAVCTVIVLAFVKESHFQREGSSIALTQLGRVFKDKLFILICLLGALTEAVHYQLYNLLSIYTIHVGLPPYAFGILVSLNGALVVALQIPIRKLAMRMGNVKAFIIAQLLFAVGYTYFMFSKVLFEFLIGVSVLTIGEIVFSPAHSAFTASLSPVDLRGRYMSMSRLFFGLGGSMGTMMGFRLYGALSSKEYIWTIFGAIGFATVPGYLYLLKAYRRRKTRSHLLIECAGVDGV